MRRAGLPREREERESEGQAERAGADIPSMHAVERPAAAFDSTGDNFTVNSSAGLNGYAIVRN